MAELPEPTPYTAADAMAQLPEWYEVQQKLKKLRAYEIQLRNKIFGVLFPNWVEGVNRIVLPDQYRLKAECELSRKVIEELLDSHKTAFRKAKIKSEELIEWKPHLILKGYRVLTEDQRKVFDEVLEIKESTPSLSIEPPATKKE